MENPMFENNEYPNALIIILKFPIALMIFSLGI